MHFDIYNCYPDDLGKNLKESMHKVLLDSIIEFANRGKAPGLTLGHKGLGTGLFPVDFPFDRRDRQ